MSALFPSGRPSDIEGRVARAKAGLDFGDVAAELGLSGSSRAGWDCPVCAGERTLKERSDHQGGRCRACDAGFDVLRLVQRTETLSFLEALSWLETELQDGAQKDQKQGSLL